MRYPREVAIMEISLMLRAILAAWCRSIGTNRTARAVVAVTALVAAVVGVYLVCRTGVSPHHALAEDATTWAG
jgi:hypothetical protein